MGITAVLLYISFLAQPIKGIRSSCTSIEAKEGDTVNLKFHFDGDIKTPQLDVNIVINLNSSSDHSIKVGYFDGEISVFPNRSGIKTSALTLEIRKVTQEYSGNYSAFVHGSDISEVKPCTLTVIASPRDEKQSYVTIAIFMSGLVLVVAACVICYFIHRKLREMSELHQCVLCKCLTNKPNAAATQQDLNLLLVVKTTVTDHNPSST